MALPTPKSPEHAPLSPRWLHAFRWKLTHVGRLENASVHWAEIMQASGIAALATTRFEAAESTGTAYAGHASSPDPQGARAAMREVLRRKPGLRHRLCALLALDYECYGFNANACWSGEALGA